MARRTPQQREARLARVTAKALKDRDDALERHRAYCGLEWHELAAKTDLTLRDFMCITGAYPDGEGEWGLYRLTEAGVGLGVDLSEEVLRGRSLEEQNDARALREAPTLSFPCSSEELLAFVDGSIAGPDFYVAAGFRRAVQSDPSIKPRRTRVDPIGDVIASILRRLGDSQADAHQVMRELEEQAGKAGSCVVKDEEFVMGRGYVLWRTSSGEIDKLTKDKLQARLRNLRKKGLATD